jgi:Spx/MgsR family transcriptional regulator
MTTADKSSSTKARAPRPAGKGNKPAKKAKVLQFSTCSTCRKARTFLKRRGFKLDVRDLEENRLSAAELEKLIGPRDHEDFLNPRSKAFQRNDMAENPPSRRKAIRLMAKEPTLIRRPIVLAGGRVVVGFDKDGFAHLDG